MAIGNLDDLLVCVWIDGPVTDKIFQDYLATRVSFAERCPAVTANLIVSPSYSPTLRQRGMMKDAESALRIEILRTFVVVSNSATVRHAVATMSWMFPRKWALKAFRADQIGEAAAFVRAQGVRASEAAIVACVAQLQALLPGPAAAPP